MPTLRLAVLGQVNIAIDERSLDAALYNKALAVLLYLATNQAQRHRREELATLFWPDVSHESGLANLRYVLHRLRKLLDEKAAKPYLLAAKDMVGFNVSSEHWLDVAEFTRPWQTCAPDPASGQHDPARCAACLARLEKTAALYRGPFLDGFVLKNTPDFDLWVEVTRETLRRDALALIAHLSRCHEKMGNIFRAIHFARRQAEIDPFDEELQQRIMNLLAANGQPAVALSHYDVFTTRLKRDIGAAPAPGTTSVANKIRDEALLRRSTDVLPVRPAERRQATVLYSTFSLAGEDDVEQAQEQIITTQQRIRKIVMEHGGHLIQGPGGMVLAYFGFPVARENAAFNAVAAALALNALNAAGISIRTGIHTGQVVSGASFPDMDGITSGIALHLSSLGEAVAISETTWLLVTGFFQVEALSVQRLLGTRQPIQAYRVLGRTDAQHRLDVKTAKRNGVLPAFFGRNNELSALWRFWGEVRQGVRRIVLLRGEAGIGKSRLIEAFEERLSGEHYVVRKLHFFEEFSATPYHPITAALEALLGFRRDEPAHVKQAKLQAYLAGEGARFALHIAEHLSVASSAEVPATGSQQQRERIQQALIDMLGWQASRQPVILILEDLHWADPSTLELIGLFARQKNDLPIFMLMTSRPEYEPAWDAVSLIELGTLPEAEIMSLVTHLGATDDMSRRIAARANGNALFAEEIARMMLADPLQNLNIVPATLRDLLSVRLDALGESKYTAQIAATLGQEFDVDLLREISPFDPHALDRTLTSLVGARLISHREGTIYRFHHALIHETVYQSQVRVDRLTTHRRIAQALEAQYPEVVRDKPEVMAQHLTAAGEIRSAINYWLKASLRATRHFAHGEVIAHCRAGLALIAQLPPGTERNRLEFTLLMNLAPSKHITEGYSSTSAEQILSRAIELSESLDDGPSLFQALWGLWEGAASRAGFSATVELGQKLLRVAEEGNDSRLHQQAHYALGNGLFWKGELTASRMHLEKSIALESTTEEAVTRDIYGRITSAMAKAYLSCVLWLQGFPDTALAESEQSIALARRHEHPPSLAITLTFAALLQRWLGHVQESLHLAREGLAISVEHDFKVSIAANTMSVGWASVMQGDGNAIAQIERSVDAIRMAMSGVAVSLLAPLVEAHLHLGHAEEALHVVQEALAEVEAKDDRYYAAELHRLKGESLYLLSRPNDARLSFETALDISRSQGARSLEQRTMDSLVRHSISPGSDRYTSA